MRASIVLAICVLSGCARAPVNTNCEWHSEESLLLDLNSRATTRHLVEDVQLAEELAIRFADSEHKRLAGYSGHGGLIENGRVISKCRATLFGTIATTHQVSMEQLLALRTARPRVFDVAVFLSFAVLYVLVVWAVVPVVLRRFWLDGQWPTMAALLFVSAFAAATGLQLGELWAVMMEMVRLGNDHLGRRGLGIPWGQRRAAIFGVGVGLFWIVVIMRIWIAKTRDRRIVAASHAV